MLLFLSHSLLSDTSLLSQLNNVNTFYLRKTLSAKKQQGCIWQLLAVRWKAAKTLTYCILHWRLNALNGWGTRFFTLSPDTYLLRDAFGI
jgi:hypothetical protein